MSHSRLETTYKILSQNLVKAAAFFETLANRRGVVFEEKYFSVLNTRGMVVYSIKLNGPQTISEIYTSFPFKTRRNVDRAVNDLRDMGFVSAEYDSTHLGQVYRLT